MSVELLQAYAKRIRDKLSANPTTPETGLAPDFQRLVAELIPQLPAVPELTVSPEYNNPSVGRPDIALVRRGQPARAFIELKAPAKSADPEDWRDAHDKRQYGRLQELAHWSTCNFEAFHLFSRNEELGSATIVPARALRPETSDAAANRAIAAHDAGPFLELLARLARADAPAARSAAELAELLAHSARLVRSTVQERISELHMQGGDRHALMMVREAFRNVLYAHPEAGGYSPASFDELFSSAFAQTLAFGLLLVREASNAPVDAEAWRHMPDEHPLMKATLRVLGALGIQGIPIDDERREANRIKAQQPILAIIGNPPYKRLEEGENETLVGRWIDELWDDLKAPVREAGQGGQLNTFPEFSVAFWRWAMWKLFEAEGAPQHGVVAFITNRKFLTGWPYAGLRKMMRERFDRIEIIDLRGDVRAGPRGDVDGDTGVFNIQVGTAITLAIADGSRPAGVLAEVLYTDSWQFAKFSRRAKLDWLANANEDELISDGAKIARGSLDDLRPRPFEGMDWLSLRECFVFASSGLETKRDHLVYSPSRSGLAEKAAAFLGLEGNSADQNFNSTNMNPAADAKAVGFNPDLVRLAGYRPLDLQFHYPHARWNDRLRPELSKAWGIENIALFSLPSKTGLGTATWCHANYPDRHAFRGSYGGYAFPLYDRRKGPNATNMSTILLTNLAESYGLQVSSEDAFDAILALLSAQSYTRRFAEDLEDVFPHVPFPADHGVLMQAVEIGREIRAVETFARPPGAAFLTAAFCRLEAAPNGDDVIGSAVRRNDEVTLCPEGRGRFSGLPEEVWAFSVSGYRVLPRWIEGRRGQPANRALLREFRDVAGRIAELIHWFQRADLVLEAVLANTLTREELGFPLAGGPAEDADA